MCAAATHKGKSLRSKNLNFYFLTLQLHSHLLQDHTTITPRPSSNHHRLDESIAAGKSQPRLRPVDLDEVLPTNPIETSLGKKAQKPRRIPVLRSEGRSFEQLRSCTRWTRRPLRDQPWQERTLATPSHKIQCLWPTVFKIQPCRNAVEPIAATRAPHHRRRRFRPLEPPCISATTDRRHRTTGDVRGFYLSLTLHLPPMQARSSLLREVSGDPLPGRVAGSQSWAHYPSLLHPLFPSHPVMLPIIGFLSLSLSPIIRSVC